MISKRRLRIGFSTSIAAIALTAAGCGGEEGEPATGGGDAMAQLETADGEPAGTVTLSAVDGGLELSAEVEGIEPGFHGFHVHEAGECDPEAVVEGEPVAFGSAGGHYTAGSESHGEHTGDFPALSAGSDGTATATVVVPELTLEELQDQDGSAIIVHADPDNLANVPSRYESNGMPGPDAETLEAGDSGDRVACGVLE
jgi:Cu-Zn family superoxide dismutase